MPNLRLPNHLGATTGPLERENLQVGGSNTELEGLEFADSISHWTGSLHGCLSGLPVTAKR